MPMEEQKATNLAMWDESVDIHYGSDFYGVERFKAGETTLEELERPEMGSVDGKTLLHLQCHFGLDTMSWARLGAKATGVDFFRPGHRPGPVSEQRAMDPTCSSYSPTYTTCPKTWKVSSTSCSLPMAS